MVHPVEYVFLTKQNLNLSVFNIIREINESKTLRKRISGKYIC